MKTDWISVTAISLPPSYPETCTKLLKELLPFVRGDGKTAVFQGLTDGNTLTERDIFAHRDHLWFGLSIIIGIAAPL